MKMVIIYGTVEIETVRASIINFLFETSDLGFPQYVVINTIEPNADGISLDVEFTAGFKNALTEHSSIRMIRKSSQIFEADMTDYDSEKE